MDDYEDENTAEGVGDDASPSAMVIVKLLEKQGNGSGDVAINMSMKMMRQFEQMSKSMDKRDRREEKVRRKKRKGKKARKGGKGR